MRRGTRVSRCRRCGNVRLFGGAPPCAPGPSVVDIPYVPFLFRPPGGPRQPRQAAHDPHHRR
ncbi:hypothetical protein EMIT0158MI4_50216 [Burkholderia ambifaria]